MPSVDQKALIFRTDVHVIYYVLRSGVNRSRKVDVALISTDSRCGFVHISVVQQQELVARIAGGEVQTFGRDGVVSLDASAFVACFLLCVLIFLPCPHEYMIVYAHACIKYDAGETYSCTCLTRFPVCCRRTFPFLSTTVKSMGCTYKRLKVVSCTGTYLWEITSVTS